MIDFIRLEVEPKYIKLQQGSQRSLSFKAYVTNYSQDFYSFYLELIVPGLDPGSNIKWYSTEPQVAAKKPPGATTEFTVNIHRSPRPGYENPLDLTVRAIAIENPELFATETLTLKLEAPLKPLTLSILTPRDGLKGYPGEIIEIPVIVSNFSQDSMAVNLTLKGEEQLDKSWMIHGTEKRITELNPGEPQSVIFECKPPEEGKALSQTYSFRIMAKANITLNPEPEVAGTLEVLPKGIVSWECDPIEQVLSGVRWNNSVNYTIKLENKSNRTQDINFEIIERAKRPHHLSVLSVQGQEQELFVESDQQQSHYIYTGLNFETIYPQESGLQKLRISHARSWLGIGSQLKFKLKPHLLNQNYGSPETPIFPKPETQTITLDVKPIIPFWLQLLALLLMLLLGGLWWLLRPKNHHTDPVNSVAFDGKANTVISGSSDRSIRYWQVEGNLFYPPEVITDENEKAVRVVRFLPKDNQQVAAGLETGEINLWNVTNKQRQGTLYIDESRNDRVFGLEFTKDSRYLLSAHGSGMVRAWNLAAIDSGVNSSEIRQTRKVKQRSGLEPLAETYDLYKDNLRIGRELTLKQPFSLLTLAISESRNQPRLVFFAGQYNKLAIWENWENWQNWQEFDDNYYYENYYDFTSYNDFLQQQSQQSATPNKLYYLPSTWENKPDNLEKNLINQYNYITSLATHEEIDDTNLPNLLASADTEGYITLWNLDKIRQCIEQSPGRGETLNCSENTMIEQWNNGHKLEPVRTVALSQNGCYLASTGDDGRVMLWSLNPDGTRENEKGKVVAQFPGIRLNSVDIKTFDDEIRLTFDGENHHVNIKKIKIKKMPNCMNERRTR
jgi:WD40 repeat protein